MLYEYLRQQFAFPRCEVQCRFCLMTPESASALLNSGVVPSGNLCLFFYWLNVLEWLIEICEESDGNIGSSPGVVESWILFLYSMESPVRHHPLIVHLCGFCCPETCSCGILMWSQHRWALSPISVISDIGLSLILELPISDWESGIRYYIGYRNEVHPISDIRHPYLIR